MRSLLNKWAQSLNDTTDFMRYHIQMRRSVTHIAKTLMRATRELHQMHLLVQDNESYRRTFIMAMKHASAPTGPIEFYVNADGTIYLNGSFDVEKLRKQLMIVPSPNMVSGTQTPGENGAWYV